jgi:hypothetical protein
MMIRIKLLSPSEQRVWRTLLSPKGESQFETLKNANYNLDRGRPIPLHISVIVVFTYMFCIIVLKILGKR